jgi:ribosome-associated protein
LDAEEKVALVREAMEELRAVDVKVIQVTEKTHLTDYLAICSGTSNIHIRAIADNVLDKLKEHDIKGIRREGYQEARWILMDFGDVLAHVFDPEDREFYALEKFWQREQPLTPV